MLDSKNRFADIPPGHGTPVNALLTGMNTLFIKECGPQPDWVVSGAYDEGNIEITYEDEDGDGAIDGEDTGCTNEAGDADGFQPSETDGTEGLEDDGCTNGVDDDLDGWFDADDPDCASGTEEIGLGTTECNDGVDNDLDTFVDAEDPECEDAEDEEDEDTGTGEEEDETTR